MSNIRFPDRSQYTSLADYHKKGGELTPGIKVQLERNYRSALIPATLTGSFIDETVAYDVTGLGKYMSAKSYVTVTYWKNGKEIVDEKWPFTMIMI